MYRNLYELSYNINICDTSLGNVGIRAFRELYNAFGIFLMIFFKCQTRNDNKGTRSCYLLTSVLDCITRLFLKILH